MLFPSVRGASEGRQRVNPNPAPIPKVHTFSHRDSMGESVHLAIAGTLGVDWDSPTDAWCRKSSVSPPLRSSFTLLSRQKFQAPCMRTQSRVFPSSSFNIKVRDFLTAGMRAKTRVLNRFVWQQEIPLYISLASEKYDMIWKYELWNIIRFVTAS